MSINSVNELYWLYSLPNPTPSKQLELNYFSSLVLHGCFCLFVCLCLAVPKACGSSQARARTHAIFITRAQQWQCQILNLLSHEGTPLVLPFLKVMEKLERRTKIVKRIIVFKNIFDVSNLMFMLYSGCAIQVICNY